MFFTSIDFTYSSPRVVDLTGFRLVEVSDERFEFHFHRHDEWIMIGLIDPAETPDRAESDPHLYEEFWRNREYVFPVLRDLVLEQFHEGELTLPDGVEMFHFVDPEFVGRVGV